MVVRMARGFARLEFPSMYTMLRDSLLLYSVDSGGVALCRCADSNKQLSRRQLLYAFRFRHIRGTATFI